MSINLIMNFFLVFLVSLMVKIGKINFLQQCIKEQQGSFFCFSALKSSGIPQGSYETIVAYYLKIQRLRIMDVALGHR